MYRLSLYLKMTDGPHLIDEIWSTDKDELTHEAHRRLVHNDQYAAVLTTYAPVSVTGIQLPAENSV